MDNLRKDLELSTDHKFKNGLDVGCGAGLSTKALRLVCDKVTGTDIADAMVDACRDIYGEDDAYTFYTAKAEETKAPDEKYDIVTAAGCINWVDEKKFMENMKEVAAPGAVIVIYDFGITDRMAGSSEYTDWYRNEYLKRFPKPHRKENKWTQEDLIEGFTMEKQTEYDMEYGFGLDAFVDFMMIQSNVNSKVESGEIPEAEARQWMRDSLAPIFGNEDKNLIFSGYSWYIRKQ